MPFTQVKDGDSYLMHRTNQGAQRTDRKPNSAPHVQLLCSPLAKVNFALIVEICPGETWAGKGDKSLRRKLERNKEKVSRSFI